MESKVKMWRWPRVQGWIIVSYLLVLAACTTSASEQPTATPNLVVNVPVPTPTFAQSVPAVPQTLSPMPNPTLAVSPTLAATPVPVLKQITSNGCCVQPFWSPDSQRILFIDKPASGAPAGLWGIDLDGGAPELVSQRVGIYSPGLNFLAYLEKGITFVERIQDGQRWEISNGGRQIFFSPDETQIAWNAGSSDSSSGAANREIWISSVDGSRMRWIFSSQGGGFAGWLPDGRILASGAAQDGSAEQILMILTPEQEQGTAAQVFEVARGARLRNPTLSPDGSWLVYLVTFSGDAEKNGLWLVKTQTGETRNLDLFGAYRWQDNQRLLVVPLDMEQTTHRLYQIEVESGQVTAVTDPALTPFKIAGGDWNISPDGQRMVFVSALDRNIWLLEIPSE